MEVELLDLDDAIRFGERGIEVAPLVDALPHEIRAGVVVQHRHTISLRVNRDDNTVLDRDGVRSDRGDGVGSPERHIADKINGPIATGSIKVQERVSGDAATANPQRAIVSKHPNSNNVCGDGGTIERKYSIAID